MLSVFFSSFVLLLRSPANKATAATAAAPSAADATHARASCRAPLQQGELWLAGSMAFSRRQDWKMVMIDRTMVGD